MKSHTLFLYILFARWVRYGAVLGYSYVNNIYDYQIKGLVLVVLNTSDPIVYLIFRFNHKYIIIIINKIIFVPCSMKATLPFLRQVFKYFITNKKKNLLFIVYSSMFNEVQCYMRLNEKIYMMKLIKLTSNSGESLVYLIDFIIYIFSFSLI